MGQKDSTTYNLIPPLKIYLSFLIIIIGASFISGKAVAQLNPGFIADTTSGCAPSGIKFIDQTTGNPTSWFWDLGNGITSTQQNPTTFYFDAGKYTIKLTVRNANGVETIIKEDYITIYSPPNINFNISDSIGCFPLNVNFKDLSDPVSGTIKSLQWDFGDGTFSTLKDISHTFKVTGDFTIALKVVNTFGCAEIKSKPSLIKVTEGVKANFTNSSGIICKSPSVIQFTDLSVGNNIVNYSWDFGDGNNSSDKNPSHLYLNKGNYSVKLIIQNSFGCKDSILKSNSIIVNNVKADFNFADSICQNVSLIFNNQSSPTPTSAFWTFGDGTTSSALNPTKKYNSAGTFMVQLISSFGNCKDTIIKRITILPSPSANFNSNSLLTSCKAPLTIKFENNENDAQEYLWNFGDTIISTTAIPEHIYTQPGTYNVSLTVLGNNGCTTTFTRNRYIYIGPPTIKNLNGVPFEGCAPYIANFSASITTPEKIATYLWNFGDSTSSVQANPTHLYNDSGIYSVNLNITTINGCTASYTLPRAIVLNERPLSGFFATPVSACAFQTVKFIDTSKGNISKWTWDFGDNNFSTVQNPEHVYLDTGTYTIKLITQNNACSDTLVMADYIYVKPPIAKFISILDCNNKTERKFFDKSVDAQNWLWNFGDGNISNLQNPTHTYLKTGIYTVTLEVFNGTCSDKHSENIWVINENPQLKSSESILCKNITINISASNFDTSLFTSYLWNFDDGNTLLSSLPKVSHKYISSGNYTPKLILNDKNGCTDTVSLKEKIIIYGPKALFTSPTGSCVSNSILFNDQSANESLFPIVKWIWNFGDGNIDSLSSGSVMHTFNKTGSYAVELLIEDNNGCRDIYKTKNPILITKPTAAFSLSDSLGCTGKTINFNNLSTGTNLKFKWDLGDGTIITTPNISYQYKNENRYNVKLNITDIAGCQDSTVKYNAINIANVIAKMNISDSTSSCPPFIMSLFNKSENFSSILWDFNDGSFSNLDSPSHFFNIPGIYDLKLIAKGFGSCTDTAYQKITVKGPSGNFSYSKNSICAPGISTFKATTTNKASFIWDFGDGNTTFTSDSIVSHVYINTGKYRPRLIISDVQGCQVPVLGKDTITISNIKAFIKTSNFVGCDSSNFQFLDSSIAINDVISKLVWSFGDGVKDSINPAPVHFYSSPGIYNVSLKAITNNGCVDSTMLPVPLKIVRSPQIAIAAKKDICAADPIIFTGNLLRSDTSNIKWSWNFGDGDTAVTQNPAPQIFNNAGIYNITAVATNSSNCTAVSNLPLLVHPLPTVFAGNDTAICLGTAINLKPTGASNYQWTANSTLSCNNCQSPVVKPSAITFYTVEGTSLNGCKNKDTIAIKVLSPFKLNISPGDTLCAGQTINLLADGTDKYTWFPATGLNSAVISNPVATPMITTTYQVVATDSQQCFTDTGYVKITVYPNPVFNIIDDNIALPVGQSIAIKTTSSPDIKNWRWLPYAGLSCNDCPQPIAAPRSTTTYKVQAWNDGGCTTTDEVTVTVICNNTNIYIPNTFSPNNDGMNDVFYPRGKGIAAVKVLTIFNRWGAVVYQKSNFSINDPQAGWNGTYNGTAIAPDVYVYKMDIVCENNEIFSLKGNITVVK